MTTGKVNVLTIKKTLLFMLIMVILQFVLSLLIGFLFRLSISYEIIDKENIVLFYSVLFIFSEIPCLLLSIYLLSRNYIEPIGKKWKKENIYYIVLIFLSLPPFILITAEIENLCAAFLGRSQNQIDIMVTFSNIPGFWGVLLSLVIICILPSIIEEILFRRIIQQNFMKSHGYLTAVVGTSIIFALIHLTPSSFLSLFLFSLILGFLYQESGSLIFPMAFHFLNNVISVLTIRFSQTIKINGYNNYNSSTPNHIDGKLLLASLFIILVLVTFGYTYKKRNRTMQGNIR